MQEIHIYNVAMNWVERKIYVLLNVEKYLQRKDIVMKEKNSTF